MTRLGISFDNLVAQEQRLSDKGRFFEYAPSYCANVLTLGSSEFSSSVLRVLRYPHSAADLKRKEPLVVEIAQDHTDLGLVTLMPCSTVSTLQLLDQQNFEWISIEQDRNRGDLVVVAGEQLSFLSSYDIPAARHRVVQPAAVDRISFPFLQRVLPDVILTQAGALPKVKLAREIESHMYSMTSEAQSLLADAAFLSRLLASFFTSSVKHGELIAAVYISFLSDGRDCSFLVLILQKMLLRAGFLALQKQLLDAPHERIRITGAKFTRSEGFSTDLVPVQFLPVMYLKRDIALSCPILVATDQVFSSTSSPILRTCLRSPTAVPVVGYGRFRRLLSSETNCS